jgi:hypothetical protein
MELDLYQDVGGHDVHAGQIGAILFFEPDGQACTLVLKNKMQIVIPSKWYLANHPKAGGYYIVAVDGGTSFLPAADFERLYKKVS